MYIKFIFLVYSLLLFNLYSLPLKYLIKPSKMIDVGTISEDKSGIFTISNTSKRNLKILKLRPGCSKCTLLKSSKSLILPGETVKVEYTILASKIPQGDFVKKIMLVLGYPQEIVQVAFKGTIKIDLKVYPASNKIFIGDVLANQNWTRVIKYEIINAADSDFKLNFVNSDSNLFNFNIITNKLLLDLSTTINITPKLPLPTGYIKEQIKVNYFKNAKEHTRSFLIRGYVGYRIFSNKPSLNIKLSDKSSQKKLKLFLSKKASIDTSKLSFTSTDKSILIDFKEKKKGVSAIITFPKTILKKARKGKIVFSYPEALPKIVYYWITKN